MSTFPRASVDSYGNISLQAGKRYFFDTSHRNFLEVITQLREILGEENEIKPIIEVERDLVMGGFSPTSDVVIPNEITRKTGYWFETDLPLIDTGKNLYGDTFASTVDYWEWLRKEHPESFERVYRTSKVIDDTIEEAKDIAKSAGKAILTAGLVIGGAFLLFTMARRGRR